MSHGLRIWGSDGALQFNTDTATWRIVLSTLVSGQTAATQQFSVPGCNPSNAVVMVIPISIPGTEDRQLETEMADGVVYVRNFIKGYAASKTSKSTMRLIVMRWY